MKRLLLLQMAACFCFLQGFAQIDFRKETIYFLITTRFFDGDAANNRPNEWCSYIPGSPNSANFSGPEDVTWRGDFKGLIQKLDYIKDLGFTAIWLTPIVQNRGPLDYHGYHAWDFTKVDSRYESTGATFKDLVDAVHAKGMKIVLDIVTNHSGRFGIKGKAELKYNTDPTKSWGQKLDGSPLPDNPNWEFNGKTPNPDDGKLWSRANLAKMPAPYNQNLANYNWPSTQSFVTTSDPKWFHQSGNGFAQGWDDTENLYNRALADDCPDLNTASIEVQDYFFNAYKQYLDAGVDAFRWDTWKHMDKQDIFALYDRFKAYKPNLFVFGEVAQKRHELHTVEEINPHWYTWRGATNASAPAGVGVIDFYAMSTFHGVFQSGGNLGGVTAAARYDHLYGDPGLLVTFLDNHDFGPNNDWNQRFGGSDQNLAACMNFMFTWRGIPSVYYGTESRFKAGEYTDIHNAGGLQRSINETGRAYFGDAMSTAPQHKIYQHIKKLNAIRKAIPALQTGNWNWAGNAPWNGVGFTRQSGSSFVCVGLAKDGDASFNFTGIPNGTYSDAVTGKVVVVSNGTLQFSVKSVSAGIYVKDGPGMIGQSGAGFFEPCPGGCATPVTLSISPASNNYEAPIAVTLNAAGGNAVYSIYFTTDGSNPTTNSTKYTGSLSVSNLTIIKAIAVDGNGKQSEVMAQRYTFQKAPPELQIVPNGGNYFDPIQITITPSAGNPPYTIYYTTNGDAPTVASTVYLGPITINSATTLRVKAKDNSGTLSEISSKNYTFNIPAPVLTASPNQGNFAIGSVNVTLSAQSPRPPVTIYYTTNGTTPTLFSNQYSSPISLAGPNATMLRFFGVDNEARASLPDSARYTFFPIPDITIYFKRPANWSTNVRLHYFNVLPTGTLANTSWPGLLMTKVCGDWYSYTLSGVTSLGIVFNDGAGKQTPDLTATSTAWYNNGWLASDPVIAAPEVDFDASPGFSGTAPLSITFNGSLTTACNGIQTYQWNFGNGETGSGQQPTTVFSNSGSYNVTLTVTDNNGQTASKTKQILVSAVAPGFWVYFKKPDAWASTVKVQYSNRMPGNTAIAAPGENMTLHCNGWYKYLLTNTTAVNLVFNDGGSNQITGLQATAPTSFIGSKKILGAPDASQTLFANFEVTPAVGAAPLTVNINAAAAIACGTIAGFSWNFGNGNTSTLANPVTTFNAPGVYLITSTVTDNFGNNHQMTKKLVVGNAGEQVKIHFRRTAGWNNTPNLYYWNTVPSTSTPGWPGVPMQDEGNGWFGATIAGANCTHLIFNNNNSPQSADLLNICGEQWYDNGWLSPIANEATLPIRLLDFTAKWEQQSAKLQWTVENAANMKAFVVERSADGIVFVPIATVPTVNTAEKHTYSAIDRHIVGFEKIFYRLKAIESNGQFLYSKTVLLTRNNNEQWRILQAAGQPLQLLAGANAAKIASCRLLTVSGQLVYKVDIANTVNNFKLPESSKLAAGVFWVELYDTSGNMVQRMRWIKQ